MSKRQKISSRFQLQKHVESNDSFEDRISQLPDEILTTILSRLTLREAAQTSIVSHRWKKLWTFTTGNLDFEVPSVMYKLDIDYYRDRNTSMKNARNKFVKWVNQVLVSHEGEFSNGFKVCFGLDSTHKSSLDKWIQFAIQKKRVARLEISLFQHIRNNEELYRLPEEVLSYSHIKLLKVLRLSDVEVSGSLLEDILAKCPSLEELSVSWSKTLLRVKLSGLNLKLIEIRQCFNVEYLEIDAPNLMSFVYTGGNPSICMNRAAPQLHAIELGGYYCDNKCPTLSEVSSFFSQIDTLALDYSNCKIWNLPPVFPEFKILKYLNLKLSTEDDKSLLNAISLIKACPMLHTFVVEFYWVADHIERKTEKIEGEELKCLKVAEFRWFFGRSADVELVVSIIESAPHLEKIIFDPWCPFSEQEQNPLGDRSLPYDYDSRRKAARICARQLANKLCPNVQLVVL